RLGKRKLDMAAQAGKHCRHRGAGFLARSDRAQLNIRVLHEQTQELHARVPRAADDARLDHHAPAPKTRKPHTNKKAACRRLSISGFLPINVSSTACAASLCAVPLSFARPLARRASPSPPR